MSPRARRLLNATPFAYGNPSAPPARRAFSTSRPFQKEKKDEEREKERLTHVSESGAAHMVPIHTKSSTHRTATAACTVHFSSASVLPLIQNNQLKKGDVLSVARIAGIMAAKKTPELIPLCHPIPLSQISIDLDTQEWDDQMSKGKVEIRATVTCDGKTGVEMEALTAASTAALTVYDMCKAVDKGMRVEGLRVVLKEGGKSGRWEME